MTQPNHSRPIFPAGLLAEGRRVLVVGGGKVALRKVGLLLDAQCDVIVVSPTLSDQLAEWTRQDRVRCEQREFADGDVRGAFMVFAATNDRSVNRHIIDVCREQKILCSSVDGNWPEGDFVTPAILRRDELTIAVSTGGKSCRRSRMIRESLGRHIDRVDSSELMVMGTSHNYLDVDHREPYQLVGKRGDRVGRMLMGVWGVQEFMLLSTCNRVELLAVVTPGEDTEQLLQCVMGFDHLKADQYYVKRAGDAFDHTALTAAGLLSQTPGEYHIVSQYKEALESCVQAGWANGIIQEWVSHALHVSKAVRNRTAELLHEFEIEDLCVRYLDDRCPDIADRSVLVIGTGMVGRGLVHRLLERTSQCRWCYHVNKPDLLAEWAGRVELCNFNDLRQQLREVDLIVCATSAEGHVLHQGHAPFFDQQKRIVMVDLGMPRNIAPQLDGLTPDLAVVDLDGLKRWYRSQAADMAKVWQLSRAALSEHQGLYDKLVSSFQPTAR